MSSSSPDSRLAEATKALEKVPVSVVMHCLNEEVNIRRALSNALAWADEVFVVDSGSTDTTLDIVTGLGVTPVQRKHARHELTEQRNWALRTLPFKHEWVYIQDADEVVPRELASEIAEAISSDDGSIDGYWVRFKLIWQGEWIRHAALYPTWTLRLLRQRVAQYEARSVNTHPAIPPERTRRLKEHFIHEDRTPLKVFMDKANYYSSLEATEYQRLLDGQDGDLAPGSIFGTPPERRRALKRIFIKLPKRHWFLFVYLYIVRRGFLDGRAGATYCVLRTFTEWLTREKLREARSRAST